MSDRTEQQSILTRIRHAFAQEAIGTIAEALKNEDPFVYCSLRDTLQALDGKCRDLSAAEQLFKVIEARLHSLTLWPQTDNETVHAIRSGEIDADVIKPHVRDSVDVYNQFYANQSERIGALVERRKEANHEKYTIGYHTQPKNLNHGFRWTHAISLIEHVFGLAKLIVGKNETIRWLDIGCGIGNFANRVDPTKFGVRSWEIVGADFQAGKIAMANQSRAKGRTFFVGDALDVVANYEKRGESFHIISMFEFLEHLDDPLKFIKKLGAVESSFILAASPLEQKLDLPRDRKPDRVHFWSYSRVAWEQMFASGGLTPIYASETRVGHYVGGLDWLSMICGPLEECRSRRTELYEDDERDATLWHGEVGKHPRVRNVEVRSRASRPR